MEGTNPIVPSTRSGKARIELMQAQRAQRQAIVDDGDTRRKRFIHARVLLMADELVSRKLVVQVCKGTVRKTLKKTSCSPGV